MLWLEAGAYHLPWETRFSHGLAGVLRHLLKHKEPFMREVFVKEEAKMKREQLAWLKNLATALNL